LISDTLGLDKPEPVETYSSSNHLFTDLNIPEGSTGRLPLSKRTRAGLSAEPEENLGSKRRGRGDSAQSASPARQRTRKPRQRTRGGADVATVVEAVETGDVANDETNGEQQADGARTRTRRRTRGAAGRANVETSGPAEKDAGENGERPARRRRRRSGGPASSDAPANSTNTPASAD
jgi:hypothetical protein